MHAKAQECVKKGPNVTYYMLSMKSWTMFIVVMVLRASMQSLSPMDRLVIPILSYDLLEWYGDGMHVLIGL